MDTQDHEVKLASIAKILNGRVVPEDKRVQVCVKGKVLGFPATFEALVASYPFGVTYILETNTKRANGADDESLRLVITPRLARGLFGFVSRLLIFEGKGQKLDIPAIDSAFVCSFNAPDEAKRFMRYPGIQDKLLELEKYSHFSELLIKADSGLCLSQPKSFNGLDLDVFTETFRLMAEVGQVLSTAFV